MSPFGHDKRDAENAKLHSELERISALGLQQLAAEVMTKGFGAGGPAEQGPQGLGTIAGAFNPAEGFFGIDDDALVMMAVVVAEGMQVLEHACLVREVFTGGDVASMAYTATRFGRAALAQQGGVEKVLSGGSL
jgi:hypothetical protein